MTTRPRCDRLCGLEDKLRRSFTILSGILVAVAIGHAAGQAQALRLPPPPDGAQAIREIVVPGNGQGFAGLAALDGFGLVIYYDSVWIQKLGGTGSDGFRFLRAHEYAHHRLNHAIAQYLTPPALMPYLSYSSELEADCEASRVLRRSGDTAAIQAGFNVYQTGLPPYDSGNRPGAVQRTQNMNSCLGIQSSQVPAPTPMGRSCQTSVGRCGPFYDQPAMPVGAACYCATPAGPVSGRVVQ